jgi:hypothetical protein
VIVGLHPNAQQFMAEVPNMPSSVRDYSASADETGFFWLNTEAGARSVVDHIVTDARLHGETSTVINKVRLIELCI